MRPKTNGVPISAVINRPKTGGFTFVYVFSVVFRLVKRLKSSVQQPIAPADSIEAFSYQPNSSLFEDQLQPEGEYAYPSKRQKQQVSIYLARLSSSTETTNHALLQRA